MPKGLESWKVFPHRPLQKPTENVWYVEGDAPGTPLKRVMTLARRIDGSVVVHSAIALEDELMKEIEAWGRPAHLLVPNGYHRLDAKIYKRRYPEAKVYCPRGSRDRVEEVVSVDGCFDEFPPDDRVWLVTLEGTREREGAMIVREDGHTTLVLNDSVFNMPHVAGLAGLFMRLANSSGGPRVSRIGRMLMIADKPAFIAQLDKLASLPGLERVIVSHHLPITSDAAAVLRSVADSLR